MKVTIRFYGTLRELVGAEKVVLEIEGERRTFLNIVLTLIERYPQLKEYMIINGRILKVRGLSILVNGQHVMFLGGEEAEIRDGSIIDILPPVSGGLV